MRFLPASLATLLSFVAPALAQEAPREISASAPKTIAVTVYRDNLALITETREVDLPGGPARIVFDGVLDRIIPQSAIIRGFEGAEAERNFDFDGLNGRSLLLRSIGETVTVRRTQPGSGAEKEESAVIQAAGDGVTLHFADRYEALGCSGVPEQIIFPRIPDGLRAKPALSTQIVTAEAGKREVTLSYLATGVEWQTDYVVTLNADATRADVLAWITLKNEGEEGFEDATVGVIAGDLSRVWDGPARANFYRMAQRSCWAMDTTTDFPPGQFFDGIPPPPAPPPPMVMAAPVARMAMEKDDQVIVTGARIPSREELGDYQLYTLADRTTLAAQQTKQVVFLSKPDVQITRLLRHEIYNHGDQRRTAEPLQVVLRTMNEEAKGLGEPLPRGTVRLFAPLNSFGTLYSGEAETNDTAVGLKWEFKPNSSADVTALDRVVRHTTRALSGDRVRHTVDMSVELSNATASPQTVELEQAVMGASQRLSNASATWAMQDGAPTFTIVVPPHDRVAVRYRVTYIRD